MRRALAFLTPLPVGTAQPPDRRTLAWLRARVGDAAIACFDAKYAYSFWRPVQAIRAGVLGAIELARPGDLVLSAPQTGWRQTPPEKRWTNNWISSARSWPC